MTEPEVILARAQLAEVRLLLRFASARLTKTERVALSAFVAGVSDRTAAAEVGNITRAGIWMAQQSGLRKMRRRLEMLGITSASDLL